MEQTNKRNLLPGFNPSFPTQFSGLQSQGTNSFMSTLQSLQMQSLGGTLLPSTNLTNNDLGQWCQQATSAQQSWIDQAKVAAAMLPMYLTGMKTDTQQELTQFGQTNGSYNSNPMQYETSQTSIFPMQNNAVSIAQSIGQNSLRTQANDSLSQISSQVAANAQQNKFASMSLNPAASVFNFSNATSLQAAMQPSASTLIQQQAASLQQSLQQVALQQQLQKNAQLSFENPIPTQPVIQPVLHHPGLQHVTLQQLSEQRPVTSAAQLTSLTLINSAQQIADDWMQNIKLDTINAGLAPPPATSTAAPGQKPQAELNHVDDLFFSSQQQTDDVVDSLFTMVNRTGPESSIFNMPSTSTEKAPLSPVQFTPPDSPTDDSSDLLFRMESGSPKTPSPNKAKAKMKVDAAPANKSPAVPKPVKEDAFKVPALPEPAKPPKKEPIYARKIVKSNKVPVYKQKMNTLSMINDDAKKDSKTDAYSFEDDEPTLLLGLDSREKEHEVFRARLMNSDIITLAESIRRRKNERFSCKFVKIEHCTGTDCARDSGRSYSDLDRPPLPKLIIRFHKKPVEGDAELFTKNKKRRGRKRKNSDDDDDDDSDWERGGKKRKMRAGSRRGADEYIYEVKIVERDRESYQFSNDDYLQKKSTRKRRVNGSKSNTTREQVDSVRYRLSKFGSAEGHLPKGTFVVCKADLTREDCALWKVDNQNLLQKFPPRTDPSSKALIYKNSSTYSGWCEQISSQYFRVSVRIIKQSRSETVVEPEIPLLDLFPAMATVCLDSNDCYRLPEATISKSIFDESAVNRDPLKSSLNTLIQSLITHALTLQFIQEIQQKNDWAFLRALTEIDRVNEEMEGKIRSHIKFNTEYEQLLKDYTLLHTDENEASGLLCQNCGLKFVEKVLQLYAREVYDRNTLQLKPETELAEDENKSPLPAVDILVCSACATAAVYMHRMFHVKFHLLQKCEEQLEWLGTQHPEYSPEKIVDTVKKNKNWIMGVIIEYADMWKRISQEY